MADRISILGIEPACPLCRRVGGHAPTCLENLAAAVGPCALQDHRWAYLTAGGQACGVCGVRR